MKNKIILFFAILVGISGLYSCSEDELTQINPNVIDSENFWLTMSDCEDGVVAIYNAFKAKDVLNNVAENRRADLAHKAGWSDNSDVFYNKTWNNSKTEIQNKWAALYKGIFRANQAIEGLTKFKSNNPDLDEDAWNDLYAQAHFFRGLFHFYLYNSFNEGSIPIRDCIPTNMNEYYNSCQPAEEVFAFIMRDLEFAYTQGFLPEKWEKGQEGRITRGAVAAVMGQAYLYEGDYTNAKIYLKDVIDNYGYALTADPSDNVTTQAEFNSESILEIAYSYALKPEEKVNSELGLSAKYVDDVSPLESQWGAALFPSYWLQMEYKNDPMDPKDPRNLAPVIDILTGETLKAKDGTDSLALRKYNLRASAYIAFVDDEAQNYYMDRPAVAWAFNNGQTAVFKMMSNCNEFTYNAIPNEETFKSGVNYRLIRLADVYLMYAECLIKGGTDPSGVDMALAYINKVRYRSALMLLGTTSGEFASSTPDGKTYSAQDVMDHLMYVERPLEVSILGHASRHNDLRRWGIYKKRFEDLASRTYAFGSYPYEKWSDVDVDGEPKRKFLYPNNTEQIINPTDDSKKIIRWGSVVYDESYFDDAVDWDLKPVSPGVFKTEYDQSKANYISSIHDYWPIPLVEESTNPNLFGN